MNEEINNRLAYKLTICILVVIIGWLVNYNRIVSNIYEDEIEDYQNIISHYEEHKQFDEMFRGSMIKSMDQIVNELIEDVIINKK